MREPAKIYNLSDFIKAMVLISVIISILGYLDYVTGEVSIDILYIICICFVTWYTNIMIGVLSVVEIMISKTTADYYDNVRIGTHLYEWNTFNFLVLYLIVCVLVGSIKRILSR